MEASIPADASYDKSHWFEGGDSGAASRMQLSDSVALLLADEQAARTRGMALTRKEAERYLQTGVGSDSEILHGPVKHVAARVNSIIAAAFLLVKKERERAVRARGMEQAAQGETHLLLSKLEEIERERGSLLAEIQSLREEHGMKEQESAQRERDDSQTKEHVLHLERREKELMGEIEDLYTTTIERERAAQEREREREEKIKILELEMQVLREREGKATVERERELEERDRERKEEGKRKGIHSASDDQSH